MAETNTSTEETTEETTTAASTTSSDELGSGGRAALQAERDARKRAEKAQAALAKKVEALESAQQSDQEKLEARAKRGDELAAKATESLRKANLRLALADKGLTGSKAKAAARLIDEVEYDDDGEPINLDARIKAATAAYGDEFFKGATPSKETQNNEDEEETTSTTSNNSDTTTTSHAGPRRDAKAEEEEAKLLDSYVRENFPGFYPEEDTAGAGV